MSEFGHLQKGVAVEEYFGVRFFLNGSVLRLVMNSFRSSMR